MAFRVDEETVGFCLLLTQSSFYSELLIRSADSRSAAVVAMIGQLQNGVEFRRVDAVPWQFYLDAAARLMHSVKIMRVCVGMS